MRMAKEAERLEAPRPILGIHRDLHNAVVGSARTGAPLDKLKIDKAPGFVHCVIFHIKKDAPGGEVDAMIADYRGAVTCLIATQLPTNACM